MRRASSSKGSASRSSGAFDGSAGNWDIGDFRSLSAPNGAAVDGAGQAGNRVNEAVTHVHPIGVDGDCGNNAAVSAGTNDRFRRGYALTGQRISSGALAPTMPSPALRTFATARVSASLARVILGSSTLTKRISER